MILIVDTSLDYIFAAFDPLWVFRRMTTFINFALSPVIPICLLKIFEENKNRFYIYIPAIINAVICFISIFYQLVFMITPRNTYGRGPLFFVPLAVTIFYIIAIMIKPLYGHNQNRKNTRAFLMVIIFLIIASMFFEIYFGYRFLNYGVSALGLIMYYMLINIQGYSIDPLTGVYNRIKYNRALEAIANSTPCILALADLNNFKQVNDNYGHD
ncbi:MAG: diguanylate cyclase, partial [Eubacterium sp.]